MVPHCPGRNGLTVRLHLGVVRQETHRDVEAHREDVLDAEVELERPLERVLDELGAPLPEVVHAQERVAVVEDEAEAEGVPAEDVGAVGDEQPLGVERGAEQVGIHAGAVAGEEVLGVRLATEACDEACHRPRQQAAGTQRPHPRRRTTSLRHSLPHR